MKSAIYLGKKNVKIKEMPIPEISDNDVLIKNIYSSICGTDIESIITHEFPIEQISKAIETAADSNKAFNVVINFNEKND